MRYQMSKRQHWITIAQDIDVRYKLDIRPTPFRIMLDLRKFDANDAILIEIELETFKLDDDGSLLQDFIPLERYEIARVSPKPGDVETHVNGIKINTSPIVIVEPINGPWRASIWYTQTKGATKVTRYLLW